jgi:hypothetical protein
MIFYRYSNYQILAKKGKQHKAHRPYIFIAIFFSVHLMNPQNQEKQSARLARRIKLKDKKNKGHSVLNGDVPHPQCIVHIMTRFTVTQKLKEIPAASGLGLWA